jgi:prepilin-type N-terminal cleavage/methylation domain-containing protein
MNQNLTNPTRRRQGFSLLELMLAVSIMSVIVIALYGMFYQVQRGLRANVTQVDVLEGSRAALDILSRDVAAMSPCDRAWGTNLVGYISPAYWPPTLQIMAGRQSLRTNVLQEVSFLTRYGREFTAIGYRVIAANNGVGTLSRYTTNARPWQVDPTNLIADVIHQHPRQFTPVLDGVIHFRAVPYDAYGVPMIVRPTNLYAPEVLLERDFGGYTRYTFLSNALPAYLEIELGVLEPRTLEQFKTFPQGSDRAKQFLAEHAGQVHLFRQRVPVRLGAEMRPVFSP